MELVFFSAVGIVLSMLVAIAIFSRKPQASLARGILASAGVVAGAWATTASTEASPNSAMLQCWPRCCVSWGDTHPNP